jgi:Asp-tRNA(Asn)/Glu-tRNA(Gln) amidotransferase A subunit family amidase
MVDLTALDATRIAAACAGGSLDPGDVVGAFRQHIDDLNPTLNAVVGEIPQGLGADVACCASASHAARACRWPACSVIVKDTIWVPRSSA